METKSGDRQLTETDREMLGRYKTEYQTAVQMQKQRVDDSLRVAEILKHINLRVRAVELAAQFKSDDPMKLTREIYKFLSDTEV